MQDPIADMLTRIRNGQMAAHTSVTLPMSNSKEGIAKVLLDEGYITGFKVTGEGAKKQLEITLKYYQGRPVIDKIKRISKTGLRVYRANKELSFVPGFGITILSTSKGIMSHLQASNLGVGGEVLCEVA